MFFNKDGNITRDDVVGSMACMVRLVWMAPSWSFSREFPLLLGLVGRCCRQLFFVCLSSFLIIITRRRPGLGD